MVDELLWAYMKANLPGGVAVVPLRIYRQRGSRREPGGSLRVPGAKCRMTAEDVFQTCDLAEVMGTKVLE